MSTRHLATTAARNLALIAATTTLLLALAPSQVSAEVFVKITDSKGNIVPGDVDFPGYRKQIEAQSLDFGVAAPRGIKPTATDLAIVKGTDKASARLALAGFQGESFRTVEITHLMNGERIVPTMKVILHQASVSSFSVGAVDGGPAVESVTFDYKSLEIITYSTNGKKTKVSGEASLDIGTH